MELYRLICQLNQVAFLLMFVGGMGCAETSSGLVFQRYAGGGGFAVSETLDLWKDAKRDRQLPVKIYSPVTTQTRTFPVVLFSHGLGGNREGAEYLGEHWASHGFVSIHLQHPGSDESVWRGRSDVRGALVESVANPKSAVDRPLDVRFAVDKLTELNVTSGPLEGRLELDRVGMSGHSFGGYTTLAVAGQIFKSRMGRNVSLPEPRIKAAISLSAPAPRAGISAAESFAQVKIPILHMTGTLDDSPIGETKAADRRIPFDNILNADQFLLILKDGDHMVFNGQRLQSPQANLYPRQQELIRMASLAFWLHYLKGDAAAGEWLKNAGFATELSDEGTFEIRKGKR